ncbi:MAG TPA: FliM/FliN family flagellar motor switch protein [Candidatus Binataceae bacterium]|jgi:flagellar motor switch protein FliM/N|nr:FliM/FliN family flagellar motor switch protein [Candidatus Binataceae bacterium]
MTPLANSILELEAVLSSTTMQADTLAALTPGDHLVVEPRGNSALTVRFVANGETVATASLAVEDERLIATIISKGRAPAGARIDQWKLSNGKTTA